ncbi:MAG: UDP-N-acetylmuramate dehydrogenase [Lachnospiraceae bacterium]|nr:UDP-N-acetylmuramate dehydrogenase [Lachnospiraceae bacterium]
MKEDLFNQFCSVLGSDNAEKNEPMSKHTTFRVGGPADYYLSPHSTEELKKICRICEENELPYFVIGNGSNLLVSDEGYRGAVIQIYRNMSEIEVEDNTKIRAKAGALLAFVAKTALNHRLTGMEFASGIPGTIGGAVVMNAGAYGGEMKDILEEVTVLTGAGEVKVLPASELELGYRTSIVKKEGYLVLEAVLSLEEGEPAQIQKRMNELKEQRVSKQPLEFPSAGSTFKRPEGYFAGKLIMDAGLAGYQIGGAQVSAKHCGFLINAGNATARDVYRLIRFVQKTVWDKFQVELETEVKMLGRFEDED